MGNGNLLRFIALEAELEDAEVSAEMKTRRTRTASE
jgi:hypothetical protein